MKPTIQHYLDGARGQYIPRDFARDTKPECILNVSADDLAYLRRGPGGVLDEDLPLQEGESVRAEHYWDVWLSILDSAIVVEPETGHRFRLHQDGSLFLIPEDWEWSHEAETFCPPQDETEPA